MFRFISVVLLIMAVSASHAEDTADLIASSMLGEAASCPISEGRWGGGPPMDLDYWSGPGEELLLVGAGAEVIIYNIATPTAPVELGRALLNQMAYSLAVSADGTMVSVSDFRDKVTLVDISNRNAPVTRGSYGWAGSQQPSVMAFDDSDPTNQYLYVTVRGFGMAVLDISNPDSPALHGNADTSASDLVIGIALRGNHAYLGQVADGLQIVDISNPANPVLVGNHAASTSAGQVNIEGSSAYVTRGSHGVDILDLTNPVAPTLIGNIPLPAFTGHTALLPGNQLAVANTTDGTVIFDISTPATPVELGNFGFNPFRLAAIDHRIFVSRGYEQTPRVRLLDFQNPASASEIGGIDLDGKTGAVSVGTDNILVANKEGGVVILNSINPVAPFETGRVDIGNQVLNVTHINGYAAASSNFTNTISIIDLQNGSPTVVTTINNEFQAGKLVANGNLLYVASNINAYAVQGGLRIYDMSNPLAPAFLGSAAPPGKRVFKIAVAGDYAYGSHVNQPELLVFDVSNPSSPVTVGSPYALPPDYTGGGGATDIAASGNIVYVGTKLNGVRILQNNGAGSLTEIADIDVPLSVITGVSVDGDLLYITAGVFSGMLVYDVSDPADPQFVEQHNTTGEAAGVDAFDGVIAVAEDYSGVATFGCDLAANNQAPITVGTINTQNNDEGETIFPLSTNPNFSDPDGQALSYSATGLPPGLDINAGSGTINGSLDYHSSGSYSVVITATDPFNLFVTQSFTWTINGINGPPVSISAIPAQSNDEGDSINLNVSSHFSDPDGDTLRYEAGNLPDGLSINGSSGVISGVLGDNSSGSYTTLILVYDPDDAVGTQTFNWTVADTIVVPVIFKDGFE